jgi:hypothetical protein
MRSVSREGLSIDWLSRAMDRHGLFLVACLMSLAFLMFDLILPLGVAGGASHAAVILLGLWFPIRGQIVAVTTVSVFLTVIGYFLSPEGGIYWQVLVNRTLTVFAIVVMGAVIYLSRRPGERGTASPKGHSQKAFFFSCALLPAFFALDLLMPMGVAGGIPYIAAVSLGLWFSNRTQVAITTTVSILFTPLRAGLSDAACRHRRPAARHCRARKSASAAPRHGGHCRRAQCLGAWPALCPRPGG